MRPWTLNEAIRGARVITRDRKRRGVVVGYVPQIHPDYRVIVLFDGSHVVSQYNESGQYWWTVSESGLAHNPDDLLIE